VLPEKILREQSFKQWDAFRPAQGGGFEILDKIFTRKESHERQIAEAQKRLRKLRSRSPRTAAPQSRDLRDEVGAIRGPFNFVIPMAKLERIVTKRKML